MLNQVLVGGQLRCKNPDRVKQTSLTNCLDRCFVSGNSKADVTSEVCETCKAGKTDEAGKASKTYEAGKVGKTDEDGKASKTDKADGVGKVDEAGEAVELLGAGRAA